MGDKLNFLSSLPIFLELRCCCCCIKNMYCVVTALLLRRRYLKQQQQQQSRGRFLGCFSANLLTCVKFPRGRATKLNRKKKLLRLYRNWSLTCWCYFYLFEFPLTYCSSSSSWKLCHLHSSCFDDADLSFIPFLAFVPAATTARESPLGLSSCNSSTNLSNMYVLWKLLLMYNCEIIIARKFLLSSCAANAAVYLVCSQWAKWPLFGS